MENSRDNIQKKDTNSHPEPSEDKQLEIETVTPETEKDALPGKPDPDKHTDEVDTDDKTEENTSTAEDAEQHDKNESDDTGTAQDKPEDIDPEDTDNSSEDDEGSEIETVSP